MATYTYLFRDLLTGADKGDLPLSGVSFDRQLGGVGSFGGTVRALGSRAVRRLDPVGTTEPNTTALYVDRDGILVWGGIVWGRRGEDELELRAEEFRSYWRRRRIRWNLTYDDTDQAQILVDILARANAERRGDIGLVLPTGCTTGVLRDRTYAGTERKVVEEAWSELEGLADGLESEVAVAYDGAGAPGMYLRVGSPLGRATDVVLEKPGNLITHAGWPEDGTGMATRLTSIGAAPANPDTEGPQLPPLMAEVYRPRDGYPLLEDVTTYSDVSHLSTLEAHAAYDQAQRAEIVAAPELTVAADDPPVGTYGPGDTLRVRITDSRFPRPPSGGPGMDTQLRVLALKMSPGEGRETVGVTVGATTMRGATYQARLRALERRLLRLEARFPPPPEPA